jgi:hypothetical protein
VFKGARAAWNFPQVVVKGVKSTIDARIEAKKQAKFEQKVKVEAKTETDKIDVGNGDITN